MPELPPKNEYAQISKEIEEMCERDQAMRHRALENQGIIYDADDKIDFENTEKMKEIILKIGWPTISKVGEEVSGKAWLLVQHADHDVEFQKKCLQLMEAQSDAEVSRRNIAYLEDRVRVNEGRPQLYGTQFYSEGENYGPRPIEDREHLDERRREIGMETFEEYRKILVEKYKK